MNKKVTPVKPKAKRPPSGRVYSTYDQDYRKSAEEKKKGVTRRRDRRQAIRDGRVKKGDGKDLHHVSGAAKGGKTKVMSANANRSKK